MVGLKLRTAVFVVLLGGLFLGCSSSGTAPGKLVQSSLPRVTNPQVSELDRTSQTDGDTAFAFDCYRRLAAQQDNVFYSPLSVSLALAMTWAGARTTTEIEMAKALQYRLPQERLHPFFNALDSELNSRGQGAQGKDGQGFRLRVVNSIWGQEGYTFLPTFLDVLAQNYGAGMRLLDFTQPQAAADAINRWIAEQTENRITQLLSADALKDAVAMVLTNAVYFNAAWAQPFAKSATSDGDFSLRDGSVIRVPMMRQTGEFRAGSGSFARCVVAPCAPAGLGFRAIELPYDGNQLAMLILLPDVQPLDNLEASLSPANLSAIVASLTPHQVALQMPSWTFRSPVISLKPHLTALGMPDAFVKGQADFSGMDGTRDLFVSDVLHQAFVAVDEAGTEAAAATAVIVGPTAAPGAPIPFVIDQPFVYLIRDIPTGTVVFIGRVVDPR
jgi:serpin B